MSQSVFENNGDFLTSVVLSLNDWGPRNSTATKATPNQKFSGFCLMNLNNEVDGSRRVRYRKHYFCINIPYREGEAESCSAVRAPGIGASSSLVALELTRL